VSAPLRRMAAWRMRLALALGLGIVAAGCTKSAGGNQGTGSQSAAASTVTPVTTSGSPLSSPTAPTDSAARDRYANRLRAAAAIARSSADSAPRDHDDPAAVLRATGTDPSAILNWVKTETRPVAYAGTLRGASGVLMDRAGNSLDRALLLADLLSRAGNTVRIARADLPPQAAAALRASTIAAIPKPASPTRLDRGRLLKVLGNNPQLDAPSLERAIDATLKDDERFATTVRELYGRVLPAIAEAVGQDATRDQTIAAEAEATLRDHFWVQRQVASGWEDLDPDAGVVGKITQVTTFVPDGIPGDLKHQVTLRAILETWQAGKFSETSLLERTWTPADLIDKPLTLSHRVFPEPMLDQIAGNQDPQATYLAALARAWVIEPVLNVGGQEITDRLFTWRGEVQPASLQTLRQLGVSGGPPGGFASGLGQLFGGGSQPTPAGPPDEAASPVNISAEWIEFEIKVPGRPPERHRRAIFDLVGPAVRAAGAAKPPPIDSTIKERRALALAGSTDIFIFGATPAEAWLRRVAGQGLAAAAEQAALAERAAGSPFASTNLPASRLELVLWGWALNRTVSGALPAASPVSPNVALLWQTPERKGAGSNTVKTVFDIVANSAAPDLSFSHRVAQGVLDTVVEHAVLKSSGPGGNTAALHAIDLAAGRAWTRLDPSDPKAVDRLDVPADAKVRIKDDLAHGNIVIARPQRGPTPDGGAVSWWRIDPRTGVTLGVGETGLGQALTERGAVTQAILVSTCNFFFLGEVIGGHLSAHAVALQAFCVFGGVFGPPGVGAAVGEGVIEIVIHLMLVAE
jgi:hypothetical protein